MSVPASLGGEQHGGEATHHRGTAASSGRRHPPRASARGREPRAGSAVSDRARTGSRAGGRPGTHALLARDARLPRLEVHRAVCVLLWLCPEAIGVVLREARAAQRVQERANCEGRARWAHLAPLLALLCETAFANARHGCGCGKRARGGGGEVCGVREREVSAHPSTD